MDTSTVQRKLLQFSVIHVHGIVHFAENPIYGEGECKACDRMTKHFNYLLAAMQEHELC